MCLMQINRLSERKEDADAKKKCADALHHCVGSYTERVADGKCVILFLRKCSDESKPFYTIEVHGQEVVQVRGMGNCGMTPEVKTFVAAWKQSVLCTRLPAVAA